MKNILVLFLLSSLVLLASPLSAQNPRYIYNPRIEVKQGDTLNKLKNPFVGGFETPQFSALDLNLDGTNDLLIFDRTTKKYYTFINDRIYNTISYTYAPQYEAILPSCSYYCLSYDYNNDGKMDLFIEANGFLQQYRNTSNATLSFASPDTLFDYLGTNIYCPSPNIPSFNDIDNDGDMDILTFDFGPTIILYKNWRAEKNLPNNEWKYKYTDACWGKFYMSNTITLGLHCQSLVYYPNGDDYTPPPLHPAQAEHQGSTLMTLDVDSDGDYEALVGDIAYDYLFFLKNGKREFNYPKDTMVVYDTLYPSKAQQMSVTSFPAAYFLDVDNDGKRDIIVAPNDPSGASKNKNQISFYKNIGTDRKPIFNLIQQNFLQESTIDWGGTTAPAFTDIDKDGDDDLFIATHGQATQTFNSHDVLVYYKNTGTPLNPIFELQDTNFLSLYSKNYSGLKPCFGDLNGDLLKDLLLGNANGGLKYYVNTTVNGIVSFVENTVAFSSFQEKNYTAPYLVDFDHDGKLDLFLGNYDGTISYFKNTGTTTSPAFTKMVDSVGKICLRAIDEFRYFYQDGMSVPVVADLDKDGKFDLLVGGKYGLYLYRNIENKLTDSLVLQDTVVSYAYAQTATHIPTGEYASPAVAQLDSDAVLDIMLGNIGGGITLFSTYKYAGKYGINFFKKEIKTLVIHPNPASSIITMEGFENESYAFFISDATGKSMLSDEKLLNRKPVLDIRWLQQGVYFISIVSKTGETYYGKFVKI